MKWFRNLAAALSICSFVSAAYATVIPSDSSYSKSLDGEWRFKLEQPGDLAQHASMGKGIPKMIVPEHLESFEQMDYREDASWHDLKVPGNWEMYGYSPATYGQPDNAIGIYRQWIKVPADWKGRTVKLNFDGVQNGAEIYLNGQPVDVSEPAWGRLNYHEGGWDAFQADLTPAVKFGEKNLLAIRVYKNTKSVDMDTGDFFFLGGIHRDVTLFSVPKVHIESYAVRTKLLDGGKAEVRVLVKLAGAMPSGQVVMQLKGESPVQAVVNGQGNIEIAQTLDQPRLWSAEKPNLYEMSLDLKDGDGKVIEHVEKKIGVREIEIKDGVFMVNNVPVKLEGICRHDVYPTMGTAVDESVWRKDIELMKANNINAIRTSHYPYGSGFYDLCDELGMYVADEMAACWVPTNTQELTPMFAQHARELVGRDNNHPSVVIWAVGNENKEGENNGVSAKIIRQMDPTRPRLVSCHDSNELEDNVELEDRHYPAPAEVAKLMLSPQRATFPLILLENPNNWEERNGADYGSLDLWGAVMVRDWKVIWNEPHMPGSFLWEWTDRAVADPGPVHLYDFYPKTGINIVKVKGLVDGFRNPRADLYHVKMTYAPIWADAKVSISDSSVTMHVTNRYSFTDLSELKTTWKLLNADKKVGSGTAKDLSLAPLQPGDVTLNLPAKELSQADALQVTFDAIDGHAIATYQFVLKMKLRPALALSQEDEQDVHFPHVNLVGENTGNNASGWKSTTRYPAHLENVMMQTTRSGMTSSVTEAALYNMPISEVHEIDADVVLPAKLSVPPPRRGGKKKKAMATEIPGGKMGTVHVEIDHGKFTYHFEWSGAAMKIQELGWAFELPTKYDHFSWNRQAYWSWYPETHVGRPAGTATPDSANVDITKITRLDAFDFNSTKYYCNWAKLTDSSDDGLGVNFAADDLENCRGDFFDGGYKLVVNKYCCPPDDISSSVVPDFYFTMKAGMKVDAAFVVGRIEK